MSSPVRQSNSLGKSVTTFTAISGAKCKVESRIACATRGLTAFSIEFVDKPEQAAKAMLFLPATIQSGLEDINGFAGCLVMVSHQEARLITVIVFWEGGEAHKNCERSVRRLRALIAPYLDRSLRLQNMRAHLPVPQNPRTGASSIDTRFITEETIVQEANACVAERILIEEEGDGERGNGGTLRITRRGSSGREARGTKLQRGCLPQRRGYFPGSAGSMPEPFPPALLRQIGDAGSARPKIA